MNTQKAFDITKFIALGLTFLILVLLFWNSKTQNLPNIELEPKNMNKLQLIENRPPLKELNLRDEIRKPVRISFAPGQTTYLNIWAYWCKPCLTEIPLLLKWKQELLSQLNIVFINIDETPSEREQAKKWAAEKGVSSLYIEKSGLQSHIYVSALPLHIWVDKKQSLAALFYGSVEQQPHKVKSRLQQLVAEPWP